MMRTYKGIVCEKNDKYMVFLTNEGDFLRGIPHSGDPDVGVETEFHLFEVNSLYRKRIKPFTILPVLVAAMLLVCFVASFIPQTNPTYAYVQLEGEKGVELGVDIEGNVVSIRSLNEASTVEIDEWEGLPIGIVLAKAVQQTKPENELHITTTYEKQGQVKLEKHIEHAVTKIQSEHKTKLEEKKKQKQKSQLKDEPPAAENKNIEKQPKAPVINKQGIPKSTNKSEDKLNSSYNKEQPKTNNSSNNNPNKENQQQKKAQSKTHPSNTKPENSNKNNDNNNNDNKNNGNNNNGNNNKNDNNDNSNNDNNKNNNNNDNNNNNGHNSNSNK